MEELEKYKKESLRTRAIRNNDTVRNLIHSIKQQLLEATETGHFELKVFCPEKMPTYTWQVILEVLQQETGCNIFQRLNFWMFQF